MSENNKKYHAFISYRHSDNKQEGRQWATWLHQAIETYEVPEDLVGTKSDRGEEIPARIYPIFRDEEELPADADLGSSIVRALDNTQVLIVLCSPNAVQSTYVADEIDYFKNIGGSSRIIAAMIAGEPNTSWDKGKQQKGFSENDECFPTPLQFAYDDQGQPTEKRAEPIAADFRLNIDGQPQQGWTSLEAYRQQLQDDTQLDKQSIKEKVQHYEQQQKLMLLKIIAGILGVPLGKLTERDRVHQLILAQHKAKRLRQWLSAVAIFAIIAVGAGIFAYIKQEEAKKNEFIAIKQSKVAEQEKQKANNQREIALKQKTIAEEQTAIANRQKKATEQQLVEANHNLGLALYERGLHHADNKDYMKASYLGAVSTLKVKDESQVIGQNYKLWKNSITKPSVVWSSSFIRHHDNMVISVRFTDSGNIVLSGSIDNKIRMWELSSGKLISTLEVKENNVASITFSPDEKTVAIGTLDNKVSLWNIASGELITTLSGHTGGVLSIAFSPDGKFIATGSKDEMLRIWDITSQKVINIFKHKGTPISISFSPDGRTIATGSTDSNVRIWNISNKSIITLIEGHSSIVFGVLFSPDGQTLASSSADKTIRIWDVSSGNNLHILKGHTGYVYSVAFSPDSKLIASGAKDNSMRLWDSTSGKLLNTISDNHSEVLRLSFSPDGSKIVTGLRNGALGLWDVLNNKHLINLSNITSSATCAVFSSSGINMLTGAYDGSIKTWSVSHGKLIDSLKAHKAKITSLDYSPDGKYFATSADNIIRLWNAKNNKLLKTLKGHKSKVMTVKFSPDGKILSSGSSDGTIGLWDVSTGKILKMIPDANFHSYSELAFSSDGNTLAFGTRSRKQIRILDSLTGIIRTDLSSRDIAQNENITSISFSPDGKYLASSGKFGGLYLWNSDDIMTDKKKLEITPITLRKGKLRIFTHLELPRTIVSFSPDSTLIATSNHDNEIQLWDLSKKIIINKLPAHTGSINSIKFSPDGTTLVSTSKDKTVRLWNLVDDDDYFPLPPKEEKKLLDLKYKPNGEWIASKYSSKKIVIWDVTTKNKLAKLERNDLNIGRDSIKFQPKTDNIAAIDDKKNTIFIWNIINGNLLNLFTGKEKAISAYDFTPDGKRLAVGQEDKSVHILDISSEKIQTTLNKHQKKIKLVKFFPDGAKIAVVTDDGTIYIWDINDKRLLKTIKVGAIESYRTIKKVTFSTDMKFLAVVNKFGKNIDIWNINSGKFISSLGPHQSRIQGIKFMFDTNTLISDSYGALSFWNIQNGKIFLEINKNSDVSFLSCLDINPNKQNIAFCSHDNSFRIFDVENYQKFKNKDFVKKWIKSSKLLNIFQLDGTSIKVKSRDTNKIALYLNDKLPSPSWPSNNPYYYRKTYNTKDKDSDYFINGGNTYFKNNQWKMAAGYFMFAYAIGNLRALNRIKTLIMTLNNLAPNNIRAKSVLEVLCKTSVAKKISSTQSNCNSTSAKSEY